MLRRGSGVYDDVTVSMTHSERAARRGQLRRAVLAGIKPADVAAEYGVTRALVYTACGKGKARQAARRRRREKHRMLAEMVQAGMRVKDV